VRLLSGTCYTLQDRNRAYLHTLESDRLSHLPADRGAPLDGPPARRLGAPDIELRGHFLGHYLSASGLMYSSTGDELLKAKAQAIVAELAKVPEANGGGWLRRLSPAFMQRLTERLPVWAPFYTLHKIMAGLLDVHEHCGDALALEIALGMAAWIRRWAGAIGDDAMARILDVEYGGMNEVLYDLYAVTGDRAHAELAHRFDQARLFDALAEGRDELQGLHANTTLAKVVGAGSTLRALRRGARSPAGGVLLEAGRPPSLLLHRAAPATPSAGARGPASWPASSAPPPRSAAARTTCSSSRGTSSAGIRRPSTPTITSARS
jgi:DUF1680 family protein